MKKAVACLLLGCLPSFGWDAGFDFRASQSFVVDPTYAVFASNAIYPTTLSVSGQPVTFGWESTSAGYLTRDRDSAADPRLAGISCNLNDGTVSVFRVDLPVTGAYTVALAAGDAVYGETTRLKISSGSSDLFTVNTVTGADFFADAAGSVWSGAAWPGSNVSVQKTLEARSCG